MKDAYKNERNMLTTFKIPSIHAREKIINVPEWIKNFEHPLETSATKIQSDFARVRRIGSPSIDSTSTIQRPNAHSLYLQTCFHENVMKPWDEAWMKATAKTRTYF
jgi:hypothetical protein